MFVQTAVCGRPHVRWCERERRNYCFSLSTRLAFIRLILLEEFRSKAEVDGIEMACS